MQMHEVLTTKIVAAMRRSGCPSWAAVGAEYARNAVEHGVAAEAVAALTAQVNGSPGKLIVPTFGPDGEIIASAQRDIPAGVPLLMALGAAQALAAAVAEAQAAGCEITFPK